MQLIKLDLVQMITEYLTAHDEITPDRIQRAVKIAYDNVATTKCDDCGVKIEKGINFSNHKSYDERRSALICEDCLVKALGILRGGQ